MVTGNKYKDKKSIWGHYWQTFKIRYSKPPYPPPGYYSIYMKSDGKMYLLDSDGVETAFAVSLATVGFGTAVDVGIVGDAITFADSNKFRIVTLDTEGLAGTDDLDTINGGTEGELLILQCTSDVRNVVVKKGTSLKLQSTSFTLNNTYDQLMLRCISDGVWVEISRASNS